MNAFAKLAIVAIRNDHWSMESALIGYDQFLTYLCNAESSGTPTNASFEAREAIMRSDAWIGFMRKLAKIAKAQLKIKAEPRNRTRKAIILPILKTKGWSIYDWANEAEVSHATAMDYLNEKTEPYLSTIKKLADALNIPTDKMPE
jgi:lambda repressor-like predicted transcriptional regulator